MLIGRDGSRSADLIDMVNGAIELSEDLFEVGHAGAAEGVSAEESERTARLRVVAGVADEASQELIQGLTVVGAGLHILQSECAPLELVSYGEK